MARILGIDFGVKRSGIAATDPFQIIVSALATVETKELRSYLERYLLEEKVEKLVIGLPKHRDGSYTDLKPDIDNFCQWVSLKYPNITIEQIDERFTSFLAKNVILDSGLKKKDRRDKMRLDKISAVLILQRYLGHF